MRAGGPNAFLRAGTGAPAGEGLLRVPGPPWLRPERAACPKDGLRPGAKGGMTLKSIKPGRGPSAMSAVSSVVAVIFGVFWTVMTVQMGGARAFTQEEAQAIFDDIRQSGMIHPGNIRL